NFFSGPMKDQQPVQGVLPYDVITPLFTDYAHKKRFVWMPSGTQATYAGDHVTLDFDDGAVLIKTFYYDHVQPSDATRIIETRLLFKVNGEWKFADYIWNAEQTEAVLDLEGSVTSIAWTDDNGTPRSTDYRIPSHAECVTCHKKDGLPSPIGPKPQNLRMDRTYTEGTMDQLSKWVEMGYLTDAVPSEIVSTVRWDDPSQDLTDRVRSYVDMNCSHCHSATGYCNYRPMRFAFNETTDPANLGVCVEPHDIPDPVLTYIVARGNAERSVVSYRMHATAENMRMPLLGRTLVHEEGVALIDEWIESLDPPCN
ncbi:MAG TPA: hypothetical protein VGE21_03890, partial [Flavobacteriales bacterium]